jgi:hypothetical protein
VTHLDRLEWGVADAELVRAISASADGQPRPLRVMDLMRRPFEYATSATIEHVAAVMDDGATRQFVLKHVSQISEKARRAKPAFVLDPQREIEVYRRLLSPMQIGPRLIGSAASPQTAGCWLLIEHVDGHALHEEGDLQAWMAVARWTAEMHARFAALDRDAAQHDARLLKYDRGWYAQWLDRARRFFSFEGPAHSRRTSSSLRWLADRYEKVIERLLALPLTVVHGELYASNVLIRGTPSRPAVYPVDWEMTAIGPGIVDLAALTSGYWTEADRRALIAAYASGSDAWSGVRLDDVIELVMYAQIHLAVQWLGWFGRRQAAAGHARDWLSDAVDRAEALRL